MIDWNVLANKRYLQELVWTGEYTNGSIIQEYNDGIEYSFNSIIKSNLIRFGLVGSGAVLLYEVNRGTFKLLGKSIDICYVVGKDKQYDITNLPKMYTDIITYKDAESVLYTNKNNMIINYGVNNQSHITQYNFGHKGHIKYNDGTEFNYSLICHIPNGKPISLEVKLSSNKDLNGNLVIYRNDTLLDEIPAIIESGKSYKVDWMVR